MERSGSKSTYKYAPLSYHNVDDDVWDGSVGQKPGFFVESEGDPRKAKKIEPERRVPKEGPKWDAVKWGSVAVAAYKLYKSF